MITCNAITDIYGFMVDSKLGISGDGVRVSLAGFDSENSGMDSFKVVTLCKDTSIEKILERKYTEKDVYKPDLRVAEKLRDHLRSGTVINYQTEIDIVGEDIANKSTTQRKYFGAQWKYKKAILQVIYFLRNDQYGVSIDNGVSWIYFRTLEMAAKVANRG